MPTQGPAKRRTATDSVDKPAKRTRVSRACDQCRIAREKCDGLQPACTTCSLSRRRCAYTTNPKKRGIQPGYIRSLELALVWLFQLNPDNEAQLIDQLVQGGASSLFLSRDSKESNKLHRRWRKGRFYTDVDKLLSGGEPSRHEPSEPLSPQSDGEESDAEEPPISIESNDTAVNNDMLNRVGALRPFRLQPTQSSQSTQPTQPTQPFAESFTINSIPSDGWSLFDVYFTYTHSWFPICEKHDILKLSYSYPAQGTQLSPSQTDFGSHAELWSILAVASLHDASTSSSVVHSKVSCERSVRFYDAARSLVPTEVLKLDLGHIKALLNLAVFDITRSHTEAAWLLVGHASRILEVVDQSKLTASSRRRHVFAGCLLLDSMLTLGRGFRRPHFRGSDMRHLGQINEDGLEEWQPWTGRTMFMDQMRTPLLAFSSFNSLLDLVDILALFQEKSSSDAYTDDTPDCLMNWESFLPPKLDYIRSELSPASSTPPAVLLQLTYYCALFATKPSAASLHRLLGGFEGCHRNLGFKNTPTVVQCLMKVMDRFSIRLILDDSTRNRLQKLHLDIAAAWPKLSSEEHATLHDHSLTPWMYPVTTVEISSPDPPPTGFTVAQLSKEALGEASLDRPKSAGHTSADALPMAASLPQSDPRFPELTSDLESFFDDLASLDNTARLNTQPQFMQNLGFAPDASMADLFSEYIPMQSSAFLAQDETADFDPYSFYNVD